MRTAGSRQASPPQEGFSLIEVLIGIALTGVIVVAMTNLVQLMNGLRGRVG